TFSTASLAAGLHSMTAVFNASTNFNSSTSLVLTQVVNAKPTAIVSGGDAICPGDSATIQAALSGVAPWTIMWSDGVTQSGLTNSPATRLVSPAATTNYSVTSVSDAN